MPDFVSVDPGLKLAIDVINAKLRHLQSYKKFDNQDVEERLNGACTALYQVRERLIRSLGPE